MKSPPNGNASPLESLSKRERSVVELAVAGNTDELIAQGLGLSVSTVNSYWVRIRGKMGQLTRTELVAMVLRDESERKRSDLVAENERLGEGAAVLWTNLAQARSEIAALRGMSWHLLALDRLPEAVLVTSSDGTIEYANGEAHRLFRASPMELEGLPVGELSARPELEEHQRSIEPNESIDGSNRTMWGLDRPYYALRRDGTNFRAVRSEDRFETTEESMAVLTVRPFLEEMQVVLSVMRKPLDLR